MKLLAAILLGVTVHAQAAVITVDYEDEHNNYRFDNFTVGGMQFSPLCAVIVEKDRRDYPGQYLSADRDNNCGDGGNPNYRGDFGADLWIEHFGQPFTLLSLDTVAPTAPGFPFFMNHAVWSSRGGLSQYEGEPGTFRFTGPLWTDVLWIAVMDSGLGAFHEHHGWDNLKFDVRGIPEPATLLLIGLACLAYKRLDWRKTTRPMTNTPAWAGRSG